MTVGTPEIGAAAFITGLLRADTTLNGLVTNRIFTGGVPAQGRISPWMEVNPVSGIPMSNLGTNDPTDRLYDVLVDVKAVLLGTDYGPLQAPISRANWLLANAAGESTTITVHSIEPDASLVYPVRNDDGTEERHNGTTFRLLVSLKA